MQAAKDTFLKTLATRLATVNAARVVTIDGASRPAVLAVENENVIAAGNRPECFLLSWEEAGVAGASLWYVDCRIVYYTRGAADLVGTDRGRILTAMDTELRKICAPREATKYDYTSTTPAAQGTNVFWSRPAWAALTDEDGLLTRTTTLRLYFFPEVS